MFIRSLFTNIHPVGRRPPEWSLATVITGAFKLPKQEGAWGAIWATIHWSMVSSLHAAWTSQAHGENKYDPHYIWGSFRRRLFSGLYTAWRADVSPLRQEFWNSWGRFHVLASPGNVSLTSWLVYRRIRHLHSLNGGRGLLCPHFAFVYGFTTEIWGDFHVMEIN